MVQSFFFSWNTADWVSISLSLLLFIAGAWVSKILGDRQEQVMKEIRELQEATAELQIREKIGVVVGKINAIEFSNKKQKPSADLARFAMNIWQDGLSVLPLFKFASERLQIEYRDALAHALVVLHENPYYKPQLEGMFTEIGEQVAKLEYEKLKCATILKGSMQQVELEINLLRKRKNAKN